MPLLLLLGGARSGKSRLAARLVSNPPGPVVFIATAEARDADMLERIRRHKADRPSGWTTIEEPVHLEAALLSADGNARVVVDCLTLWTSNVMELGFDDLTIEERARAAASVAAKRTPMTVVVTNEVGMGIHPDTALGRRYRDVLGRVNSIWAAAAEHVALVVAGRVLTLPGGELVVEGASSE
jgi:adenosylcobinamide kinase/adenosylcobinamide-phosphate guanylyltransferase